MSYNRDDDGFSTMRIAGIIFGVILLIASITLPWSLWETVEANEIVIKQGVVDGKLDVWTQPGLYWQGFGTITRYSKSGQFWFSAKRGEGSQDDQSIKVRFNDGGHGNVSGSLSFDMPMDPAHMVKIHSTFGSMDAVQQRLVAQAVTKATYMTGPLMSSKESAGERRADLINFISDQASRGVYRTEVVSQEVPDLLAGEEEVVEVVDVPDVGDDGKPKIDKDGKPITHKEGRKTKRAKMKTVTIVRPKVDPKTSQVEVQEASAISEFGVRLYNLTINTITYAQEVEAQIQQQQATMAVQTAMAKSKEAEQNALTVAKQGEAEATKAKWAQEVKKATAITEAQQQKEVAQLQLDTAKLNKDATIAKAEGDAEARKLVMAADGALEKKLNAWVEVQKAWADNAGKQPLVPSLVMGGSSGMSGGVTNFMDLVGAKAAKDLALDLSVKH